MLGRFFRRGKVRPGFFFPRGKNLYWYTFSGGDSIPGRFFRGEILCGGNLYATTPARKYSNAFDVEGMTQWPCIERTIGRVLGPSMALYRSFQECCTMTDKAVRSLWRALSKLPKSKTWYCSSSPLIDSRVSFSLLTRAHVQTVADNTCCTYILLI